MYVDCGTLVDGDGRALEDARFRVEGGRVAEAGVAGRTVPDDVGTLTPGAHADFVGLGSDSRDGVEAVRDVETVYRAGVPVV